MQLLIVEDNEPLVDIVKINLEILEPHIYIEVVEELSEAIEYLKTHEVHGVLLDCNIADAKGSVAIKGIKPYVGDAPITVYTAIHDETVLDNVRRELREQDRLYIKSADTLTVIDALRHSVLDYAKKVISHYEQQRSGGTEGAGSGSREPEKRTLESWLASVGAWIT